MSSLCPKCKSENIYQDLNLWICPECSYEWTDSSLKTELNDNLDNAVDERIRDAHGSVLVDGDSVVVIKDLKIKGSSGVVKGGTKVRSIKLSDAGDGHNLTCRLDGLGIINLKSEYVKKV